MAYNQLANAYDHQERFTEAHELLSGFIEKFPDRSEAHKDLGEHWIRAGRLDAAVEAFETAEAMDPNRRLTNAGRFRVAILRERWQDAEDAVTPLANAKSQNTKARGLRSLALVALYHGDSAKALRLLEQSVSAFEAPGSRGAAGRTLAAPVELARGEFELALELARASQLEAQGNYPEWEGLFYEAMVQAALGRSELAAEAAAKLRSRTESMPTDKETRRHHHLLGELALAGGEPQLAAEELEKAAAMLLPRGFVTGGKDPQQHVPIWFSLAKAHLAMGDDDTALEYLNRVADSTNEHIWWPIRFVRSFYLLAELHERRGEMNRGSQELPALRRLLEKRRPRPRACFDGDTQTRRALVTSGCAPRSTQHGAVLPCEPAAPIEMCLEPGSRN